jgi:hypothetical protein
MTISIGTHYLKGLKTAVVFASLFVVASSLFGFEWIRLQFRFVGAALATAKKRRSIYHPSELMKS